MDGVRPLVLLNAVGMTSRLLEHAPRLRALGDGGWVRPLHEVIPAVTCTAQATLLTGKTARGHGIVANGWLYRDTREVRFWQQSAWLLEAEPLYTTVRRALCGGRGRRDDGGRFRVAKLFWWFNQGADVEYSVTPKPHYGADGDKRFDIAGTPAGLCERLKERLGPFPFPAFWGPKAGLAATEWIGLAAADVIRTEAPELTLVYLPHLDYEPQRRGPSGCDMGRLAGELDRACEPILEAARESGARVWLVSEYGHCDARRAIEINRILRRRGYLNVREGPFGEMLDTFGSRAFAVVDHQIAHVYVLEREDVSRIAAEIAEELGDTATVHAGAAREELGLDHARAGEIVLLSAPDCWFAYPYWLDDRRAPDFARTVDIHRKPGFDPCELFFDPELRLPMARMMGRLIRKKLGFRTLFDVIGLDPGIVGGSHGLAARDAMDRPILIGDGSVSVPGREPRMTEVRDLIVESFGVDPSRG
jgi:hypothetical protein